MVNGQGYMPGHTIDSSNIHLAFLSCLFAFTGVSSSGRSPEMQPMWLM